MERYNALAATGVECSAVRQRLRESNGVRLAVYQASRVITVCTALDGFTARCLVCYKALANMGCMATRRLKLMLIKT